MPSMMAVVSGKTSVKREPWPGVDWMRTLPRNDSILRLTTSMPTPRPEISVTCLAVEKPGWKMRE